ncbi:MAG: ATP-binding protein [Tannerella sp.]|jgi:AAA+ ATPase superfamily predicted ATPase|nr:ATP-binding protein [Tannerella sp.]
MKYFNVAGPCIESDHYMLDATERLHGELVDLIDSKQYFVMHAARQTGKTTLLINLANKINKEGKYYAVYNSLEKLYGVTDPETGIPAAINSFAIALENYQLPNYEYFKNDLDVSDYLNVLGLALSRYCRRLDKPLVIFFDEADCLSEDMLISFLRQLRDGFVNRSIAPFPQSIALVGMRNIRDYKARIRENKATLGTASPFNIITSSLTLRNFTKEEVEKLYMQHTDETGQVFEESAMELAFEQTQGQPWLVNAIAREIIIGQLKKDFTIPITAEMVSEAIQTIILRRDVHIDQLLDKLKEERVQKVIEPMMLGEGGKLDRMSDDFNYVKDLGLIRLDAENKAVVPGNPIYGEVIIRTLTYNHQMTLESDERFEHYDMPKYYKNGSVDMNLLLKDFQQFWRENSDIWQERFQYKEAAPHLILQAFLQRVFNGGGDVHREMATGKDRLDLCINYKDKKYPVEIKINRGPESIEKGIDQTLRYMNTLGCPEGWLVVFDRDPNKSWDEKIHQETERQDGKTIHIFKC